jgi:hypothetical protein
LTIVAGLIVGIGIWSLDVLPGYFYQTTIFLFIITTGLYRFLLKTKQQRSDFFVQFYLATLVIRLIAFGAYIFLMVQNQPEQAQENTIFFLVVYAIFTSLEIGFLYRQVNR